MDLGNWNSIAFVLPEAILAVAATLVLLVACFPRRNQLLLSLSAAIALGGTVMALLLAVVHGSRHLEEQFSLFNGMLAHDPLSFFFRVLFLLATVLTLLATAYSSELEARRRPEYDLVLLCVCLGMCLLAAARNLVMIYLALEMLSLGSYVLVALARGRRRALEGGIKYVLYGGVSSGVMLYGLSLLYGLTGTGDISRWTPRLSQAPGAEMLITVAFVLILAGIAYKVALVPFHFWCPDVYEAAPVPVTAFLSVASNAAGAALLIRFCYTGLLSHAAPGTWQAVAGMNWTTILSVVAAVSMTLGNLGAFGQTNVKRLLAYSGIAHGGYLLMGAVSLTQLGIEAMLFYMVAYLFTNLTAFLVVLRLAETPAGERIEAYHGLASRNPWLAGYLALALLSLTGIPPTVGFAGKFYLIWAALDVHQYWLVGVALANTVASLYVYARLWRAMYLEPAVDATPVAVPARLGWLLTATATPILALFVLGIGPLAEAVHACSRLLQ